MTDSVWYRPETDLLVHVKDIKIYFEEFMFIKLVSIKNIKPRPISSISELKEVLNETGYEYVGEL